MTQAEKNFPPDDEGAIERAAADWVARRDRGLTAAEETAFIEWQEADVRHVEHLLRIDRTWRILDTADEAPEIMQVAWESEAELDAASRPRRRFFKIGLALAASLSVAAAALVWHSRIADLDTRPSLVRSYRVVPSDARRVVLADGSTVHLRGNSAVEPAFTANERRIHLVHGEARFEVAHDAARPFTVAVGGVAVQAVGTAFNIRFDPGSVDVVVTEGRVRVQDIADGRSLLSPPKASATANEDRERTGEETPVLTAGQKLSLHSEATAPADPTSATADDLDQAVAWLGPTLVFERTPLQEAIKAFNSFNREQLVIGDPALAQRRLGGSFRADNLDVFVRLLRTGFDIDAERRGPREIVLRSAK